MKMLVRGGGQIKNNDGSVAKKEKEHNGGALFMTVSQIDDVTKLTALRTHFCAIGGTNESFAKHTMNSLE